MEKVGAYTDRTTEAGEWRPGSSGGGQSATPMLAAYFNMLQRELINVVAAAGIALDRDNDSQLLEAVQTLISEAAIVPGDASTVDKGLVRLATAAETLSALSALIAATPAGIAAVYPQKHTMIVVDEKASGVGGGNNVIGSNTRSLNTVRSNTIAGASLSANQITLPAGTYRVEASVPFFNGDRHRGFLYNVTDAAVAILGTSENSGGAFTTRSFVRGVFSIGSSKVFELRQHCENVATQGFGDPVVDGRPEVYAEITIRREGV
ncbi:hypothetical protein [Pseudomonas sp. F(2018)]|uniref:hypothetical protein n=1 Tax=Pseudomonas sp. F(2018) TaxID=2502240 RepID=UPI0010F59C62|nr:hypothetical protein [Pseudomonas sp. F(2018)]